MTSAAPAKFEYLSLISQGSNHWSLMLVTSHVRSALCTLHTWESFWFQKASETVYCAPSFINSCSISHIWEHKFYSLDHFGRSGQVKAARENFFNFAKVFYFWRWLFPIFFFSTLYTFCTKKLIGIKVREFFSKKVYLSVQNRLPLRIWIWL